MSAVEQFADQQKEPTTGGVEATVDGQVESKMPANTPN
jgi:hypothetical protein